MKVAAICETHAVGIVPHFTGPIATAALVNCLSTFSGPVLMEYNYGGRPIDYLPECLDFKNGKAYTNQRPGLGVTPDMKLLTMIGEVTEAGRRNVYRRPDGLLTHDSARCDTISQILFRESDTNAIVQPSSRSGGRCPGNELLETFDETIRQAGQVLDCSTLRGFSTRPTNPTMCPLSSTSYSTSRSLGSTHRPDRLCDQDVEGGIARRALDTRPSRSVSHLEMI